MVGCVVAKSYSFRIRLDYKTQTELSCLRIVGSGSSFAWVGSLATGRLNSRQNAIPDYLSGAALSFRISGAEDILHADCSAISCTESSTMCFRLLPYADAPQKPNETRLSLCIFCRFLHWYRLTSRPTRLKLRSQTRRKNQPMELTEIRRGILRFWRRNAMRLLVFAAFLASIFIFAAIYKWLYSSRPDSFWFNQEIAKSQYELSRVLQDVEQRDATAEIIRLSAKLAAVRAVYFEFTHGPVTIDSARLMARSHSGYVVRVREETAFLPGGPAPIVLETSIYDPSGKALLVDEKVYWADPPLTSTKVWTQVLEDLRTTFERRLLAQDERIKASESEITPPKIWSYWDFFYFSVMTETTVGYGDILPNATNIRMWVCGQVLVGYLLLYLIINLVFSRR